MRLIYLRHLCKFLADSIHGRSFWNYRFYPKMEINHNPKGAFKINEEYSFCIVMQGPVITESNFTVETLKIYRKNFAKAILILSTWEISNTVRRELKKIDVHVIENKCPKFRGICNINMQIHSTREGILFAQKLGAEYVLKTRTDQRIYHPSLDAYLFSLIDTFPLTVNSSCQQKRLVGVSLNFMKYRLYGVSDMFLFGEINDMFLYWDVAFDERPKWPNAMGHNGYTWREQAMLRRCEVYLSTEFIKKLGREVKFTLTDSFDFLGKHFVLIDKDAIRLYWHKYTLNADRYHYFGLYDSEMSFNDWLVLYSSPDKVLVDENILEQPISQTTV